MSDSTTPIRTALVTGASRGIGRAIAVALGSRGFNVVVNYFGNADAANESVQQVEVAGGKAIAVQADVGRREDRQRLVDETKAAFGDIHLLVNNAGIPPARREDILVADEAIYDRVMDTNLKGAFFLTQLVARGMVERSDEVTNRLNDEGQASRDVPSRVTSGEQQHTRDDTSRLAARTSNPTPQPSQIININSLSAYAATVERSQYCIAKAGMSMMTDLFAARLAGEGINVYEIRPGVINTDMARGAKEKYDKLILEGDLLPIKRWGQASDVAKAVLAIVDGYLPYSTGAVIDVDGGFHIRRL